MNFGHLLILEAPVDKIGSVAQQFNQYQNDNNNKST